MDARKNASTINKTSGIRKDAKYCEKNHISNILREQKYIMFMENSWFMNFIYQNTDLKTSKFFLDRYNRSLRFTFT